MIDALTEEMFSVNPYQVVGCVSSIAKAPWDHFMNKMKQQHDVDSGRPQKLAALVWSGVEEIWAEFHNLVVPGPWLENEYLFSVLTDSNCMGPTVDAIMATTLRHAAGFDRRVRRLLLGFPYKAMLLAKSDPEVVCSDRQDCARDMLAADTDTLGPACTKLRIPCSFKMTYTVSWFHFLERPTIISKGLLGVARLRCCRHKALSQSLRGCLSLVNYLWI